MTNLEKLTKIIIGAVPEIEKEFKWEPNFQTGSGFKRVFGRPITLFDLRKLLSDNEFLKLSKIWTGKLEDLKEEEIKDLLSVVQ